MSNLKIIKVSIELSNKSNLKSQILLFRGSSLLLRIFAIILSVGARSLIYNILFKISYDLRLFRIN